MVVKNKFGGPSLYIFQCFNISEKVKMGEQYSSFDRMRDIIRNFLSPGAVNGREDSSK